jgi:hypothetical protein
MTKKHFESLAVHLAHVRPDACWLESLDQWRACVASVADACVLANPRFDRERFVDACHSYQVAIRDGALVKVSQ